MKSKSILCLTLILAILIGSHEAVLSLGQVKNCLMERSEEVPFREAEAQIMNDSSKAARLFVRNIKSKRVYPSINDFTFQKSKIARSSFLTSSLHILFRSLRH